MSVDLEVLRSMAREALSVTSPARSVEWRLVAVTDTLLKARLRAEVSAAVDLLLRWATQRRRRGFTPYEVFAALFPESVIRSPHVAQAMRSHALAFAEAPAVLALTVTALSAGPRSHAPGVRHAGRLLLDALTRAVARRVSGPPSPPPAGVQDLPSRLRADLQALGAVTERLRVAAAGAGLQADWYTAPLVAHVGLMRVLGVEAPWELVGLLAVGPGGSPGVPPDEHAVNAVLTVLSEGRPAPA